MAIKPILRGLATYVPGVKRFTNRGSGGTDSVRYCYSVWLRHLVLLDSVGQASNLRVVAELGPGDSLGTGIAALLSGAQQYYALDVKPYFDNRTNLVMLDELVELFRRRERIPDAGEFPGVRPKLPSYEFPHTILGEDRLCKSLMADRVSEIRDELASLANHRHGKRVSYFAPWNNCASVQRDSVDLAFSQAVMEHVVDIHGTYSALGQWIRPGGCMSHTIDFRSHHTASEWNGHWGYSDLTWKLILGSRKFLINREPHSSHLRSIQQSGFEILLDQPCHEPKGLTRRQVAARFQTLSDQDLATSGTCVIARKLERTTNSA